MEPQKRRGKIKVTTTTETTETETQNESPLSRKVKRFFDTGEYDPELSDYVLEIRVQKFSERSGKYLTLVGTKYTDLENLVESLGIRFGSGRYKFYVKVKDSEGKILGGTVIDDYEFLWNSEEEPPGREPIPGEDDGPVSENSTLELIRTMMEQQTELFKAVLAGGRTGPGSPGAKSSEILEAVQAGIELASGRTPAAGTGDSLTELINGPLGKLLFEKLLAEKNKLPV